MISTSAISTTECVAHNQGLVDVADGRYVAFFHFPFKKIVENWKLIGSFSGWVRLLWIKCIDDRNCDVDGYAFYSSIF